MPSTAGGNPASAYQIFDPVNPATVVTPNFAAARAVSFIRSAARCRTPSGSPSPQSSGGRMPWWRASIGEVAHALANQVVADHVALQPVAVEQLALGGQVAVVGECLVDLEMIAPTGQLQAVEPPGRRLGGQFLQRQVGPLGR